MKPFLSICIPSYNRGHRAISLVNELLQCKYESDQVEIIVSNNGSTKNVEGYEQIKSIKDDRLVYWEFDENKQYYGNINQVIRMSRGDFCIIISDEDSLNLENLDVVIELLKARPEIAVLRPQTDIQYYNITDGYYLAGAQAVKNVFMQNNYISGIIYNRKIVTDQLINELEQKYAANQMYYHYIHLIIDAFACLNGAYVTLGVNLVHEGEAEVGNANLNTSYASYEVRINHMSGMLDIIKDMPVLQDTMSSMIMMAIVKTAFLISVVRKNYEQEGYDWKEIAETSRKEMERIIFEEKKIVLMDSYDVVHNSILKFLR